MRTTVRLEKSLLEQAKREAARRGETLTALIEKGLRLALTPPPRSAQRKRVKLPVCRAGGGVRPGVNLNNSAAVLDRMEGRE